MLIFMAYIAQVIVLVIVPFWFLIWLVCYKPPSYLAFYAKTFLVGVFIAFIFIAGRWDIVGVWLRYVWVGVFILAVGVAQFRYRRTPILHDLTLRAVTSLVVTAAMILFFAAGSWELRDSSVYDGDPVDFTFPLKHSRWYVVQGGSKLMMNHHMAVHAQNYALDITGLNGFGMRALGLLPERLEAYAIFGREVVAPCSGEVTSIENDLRDLMPPESDHSDLAGNHVLIRCGDVAVLLAHLQQGSVVVRPGDLVKAGQVLGNVGNSGNTSEPHLHIHAVGSVPADLSKISKEVLATSEPIPMLFDGAFLTRNSWGGQG